MGVTTLVALTVILASGATSVPEDVLDRWAATIGVDDALSGVEVIHVVREIETSGLRGTHESWASTDGRYHAALDLGDGLYTQVRVLDGTTGWQRDHNGKVIELTGDDLSSLRTSAFLARFGHLLDPAAPELVDVMAARGDTGRSRVRVRVPDGVSVVFELDDASGLPVASEQPDEDRTQVTTYGEWQRFQGVLFAVETKQSTGNPQHDVHARIRDATIGAPAPPGVFDRPADGARDVVFASGGAATGIPIDVYGDHVCLSVDVEGEPVSMIFDTGAGATVLNATKADALGLEMAGEIEARGAGEGSMTARLIQDASIALPGVSITGQTIVAISLGGVETVFGRPVDGILGYDLISRCVVTLDYLDEHLDLHDPQTFAYTGTGTAIPLRVEDGHPHVTLTVVPHGGTPIECDVTVDSGASGAISFTAPFTAEHDLLASLPDVLEESGGYGVGGETRASYGRLATVAIGPHVMTDVLCSFSADTAGMGANPNTAGLLGGEILKRFTVTFDYENGWMYLQPNETLAEPFEREMSGMAVITGGPGAFDAYTVHRVLPGSPAETADIRVGDELVSVDGRPASELSLPELKEHLRRPGMEVTLTLRRDGETVTAVMTLRRLI